MLSFEKISTERRRKFSQYTSYRGLDPKEVLRSHDYCNVSKEECALSLFTRENIREYLPDGRLLASGGYGSAIEAHRAFDSQNIIVKTVKDDYLGEVVVGMELNDLRKEIPHYTNVYGMMKCAPPLNFPYTKNTEWCIADGDMMHIFYQRAPGIPFTEYVRKMDEKVIVSVIVQLALAGQLAYERKGFTHYDLKPENIIIEERKCNITYELSKYTVTLSFPVIARVIDYGISRVNVGNSYVGRDFPPYLVYSSDANPLIDMFKLAMIVVYNARKTQYSDFMSKLGLYFFSEKELSQGAELKELFSRSFTVGNNSLTERDNYGFIDYLLNNFDIEDSGYPPYEDSDLSGEVRGVWDYYSYELIASQREDLLVDVEPHALKEVWPTTKHNIEIQLVMLEKQSDRHLPSFAYSYFRIHRLLRKLISDPTFGGDMFMELSELADRLNQISLKMGDYALEEI